MEDDDASMAPLQLIADYLSKISAVDDGAMLFRGQCSACPPRPSAFREGAVGICSADALYAFRDRVRMHAGVNFDNDMHWLALAQHQGVDTPLLDWTENPLVALYFATEEARGGDGEIICARRDRISELDLAKSAREHFDSEKVAVIKGAHLFPRCAVQSGVMTFHPPSLRDRPACWHRNDVIECEVIPAKMKRAYRRALAVIGVDTHSLFPDLSGAIMDFRSTLSASQP